MTQVTITIENANKWDELKPILESMHIDYVAEETAGRNELSKAELVLLGKALDDVKEGRIFSYTNHRDILGR